MKDTARLRFILFAVIVLSFAFSSVGSAEVLKEKNLQIKKSVSDDKITGAKITVKESNGGPTVNSLRINYPPSGRLMVSANLTVQKGFYRVEFLDKGRTSLNLAAENGKAVQDSGEINVDETGSIQYRVTAKKANNVVLDLSFVPVAVKKDVPPRQVTSYDKASGAVGEGLNLALSCIAGKKCILQVQNMNKSAAYRKILFQIDYNMMEQEEIITKSKRGTVDDILLPDKTGEWPIGLVFGEPPRNIKIKLISADAVDPTTLTAADQIRRQKVVRLDAISEKALNR